MNETDFISFFCPSCNTEIEATPDMIGERTECPACGSAITVPDPNPKSEDGIIRHGQDDKDKVRTQALKGRTIRIELGDF